MKRAITIKRYDGYDNRAANELMSLDFIADGTFAEAPTTSHRELRQVICLEDATPILSDDALASGDISRLPAIQSFLNSAWQGTAIIASVQAASGLRREVINCLKTCVVFGSPNPIEAQFNTRLVGGKPELAEAIQRLPKRHFVMWSEEFEGPIFGITPTINTGARPSEQAIAEYMRPILEEIDIRLILAPPFEDDTSEPICYLEDDEPETHTQFQSDETPLPSEPGILADYAKFINIIAINQNLSARELNATLGMSASKLGKINAALAAHGYIEISKGCSTGGRPRVIVKITPRGLQLIEQWRTNT